LNTNANAMNNNASNLANVNASASNNSNGANFQNSSNLNVTAIQGQIQTPGQSAQSHDKPNFLAASMRLNSS
jgi:hypothetical protein